MKHALRLAWVLALAPLAPSQEPQQPEAGEPPRPPQPERGLVAASDGAFDGYTLFTPLRSTTTYLVDMQGRAVHEWESEHPPGNSVYLMDDGSILRSVRPGRNPVFSGGGEGGGVQRIAWDGTLLWDFTWSDAQHRQHHDIEPMPNGNVLLVSWEYKSAEEAIAAGRDPRQVGERGIWPDAVFEIRPDDLNGGEVVWEWHAWDHLVQDFDPERANHGDVTAHPELLDINADHRRQPPMSAEELRRKEEQERRMRALGYVGDDDDDDEGEEQGEGGGRRRRGGFGGPGGDWLHVNSVDYEPKLDLVLLSSHNLSEVWAIDHSTTTEEARAHTGGRFGRGGDLLWRWGNPRNYGGPGGQQLFAQHDARWLERGEDGELRVTVFNNGQGRPGGDWSSIDELELPFDPERGFVREPGAAFGPASPSWSYSAPETFYANFISGAERLPNGNTLICDGPAGRVFEVTRAGEVVWDYLMPFVGTAPMGDGPPGGFPDRPPGGRPDGPPGGRPRGGDGEDPGDEPERRPRGGPRGFPRPGGPPGEGPPDGGPPGGRRGPRGPGFGGGPPGLAYGLFRATRIAPNHSGLAGRELAPQ